MPPKVQDQVRHPSSRVEEVRRLAKDHTDVQIVKLFNGRGERTDIRANPPMRVDIPAVYLTPNTDTTPQMLLSNLRHNRVLHKPVALLTIVTEEIPWVRLEDRVEVTHLGEGIYRVIAHCGFKQRPNVPNFMQQCRLHDVDFTSEETTFFLGRLSLQITGRHRFAGWHKRLFAWMMHNSHDASAYFSIPPEQVVEIGRRLEA